MSTYTKELNNIFFLNDKNIVQQLHDDTALNAIPSLKLLQTSYAELSGMTDDISTYISTYIDNLDSVYKLFDNQELVEASPYISVITNIKQEDGKISLSAITLNTSHISNLLEFITEQINKLDVDECRETNKVVRAISETDGKISVEFSNIISSDITGQLKQEQIENVVEKFNSVDLSVENAVNDIDQLGTKITNVSSTADSKFVLKSGDTVGYLDSTGRISAEGSIETKNNLFVRKNLVQGENTVALNNSDRSVVFGISATVSNKDAFVWNGNTNETYTDNGHGTFNINPENGLSGIMVGNTALATTFNEYLKRIDEKTDLSQFTDESHKYALLTEVPTKVSELENDSGYLISSNFGFEYNSANKELILSAGNKVISVDATAFVKDGMLSNVTYDSTTKNIILTFNTDSGVTPISVNVSDLVDTYIAQGEGIKLSSENNAFYLDFNEISNRLDIQEIKNDVKTISSITIPTIEHDIEDISVNVGDIQTYVNKLSNDSISEPGIIPTLSSDLSNLEQRIKNGMTYVGELAFDLYAPDWVQSLNNNISSLFKFKNYAPNDALKVFNIYEVKFTNWPENLSANDVYKADQTYITTDGIELHHGDYIMIYSSNSSDEFVPLSTLNASNLKIIQAVKYPEIYSVIVDTFANYPWLSGGNTQDAEYQISVKNNSGNPEIVTLTGHAIRGNNDFIDGNNRFYGKNYFPEDQTDFNAISVNTNISVDDKVLVGDSIKIDSASGISSTVSATLSNTLEIKDTLTADYTTHNTTLENLSVKTNLSVANKLSVDSNGVSVDNILTATNSKISQISTNVVGDLSVIENTKLLGTLNANSSTTLNDTLSVVGNSTFNSDISAKSNIVVDNNLNVKNQLSVNDNAIFNKNLNISGNVETSGTTTILGETSISNNLKVSNNICANFANIYDTSITPNKSIATLCTELSGHSDYISGQVDSICVGLSTAIDTLCTELSGHSDYISGQVDSICVGLSTAIDNKVYVKNLITQETPTPTGYTDLSIVKISKEDYAQHVLEAEETGNPEVDLKDNVLYIISSDTFDVYGRVIENLTMTDISGRTPAEAVNKTYVDAISGKINTEITAISSTISNDISGYIDDLSAIYNTFNISNLTADEALSGANRVNENANLSVIISAVVKIWELFGGNK